MIGLLDGCPSTSTPDGKFTLKGVPDGAKFGFSKSGMTTIRDHELTPDGADTPHRCSAAGQSAARW